MIERYGLAWLIGLALVLPFQSGYWAHPAALWIVPIFGLGFVRHSARAFPAMVVLAAAFAMGFAATWSPMGSVYAYFALAYGIAWSIPYALDRWAGPYRWFRCLVFPCSAVAVDSLLTTFFQTSWPSAAHTQSALLPVLQVASIGGMGAIVFLAYWGASVFHDTLSGAPRRWLAAYATLVGIAVVWGALRIANVGTFESQVRVAAIVGERVEDSAAGHALHRMRRSLPVDGEGVRSIEAQAAIAIDDLFARSEAAARAGAEIVAWPEAAAIVLGPTAQTALIDRASELARRYGIHLALGINLFPTQNGPRENKAVWIDPEGEVAWEYRKSFLMPTHEAAQVVPGSREMPTLEGPWGRIALVICYDLGNPGFVRQAAQRDVDLLVVPTGDSAETGRFHAEMARIRAVEQGVSIVRPAAGGITTVIDPYGRVLAARDHRSGSPGALTALVPVERVGTVYAGFGNLFPVLCALGVAVRALGTRLVAKGQARRG